jgi:ketosteroid isomerase-like protein
MNLITKTLATAAVTGLAAAAAMTAATAANADSGTTARPPVQERSDPARTVLEYGAALDADNLDGVLKAFAADPVVAAPGAPVVKGTAEVTKFYTDLFTVGEVQITWNLEDVTAGRDLAYVTTTSLGTLTFKDGSKPITEVGRELFVLKNTDQGWKIAAYWFNN